MILLVGLGFPLGSDSKESACNAGDLGSIPGQDKGMAAHFSILAWRLPQTEDPGGLQSLGSQESDMIEQHPSPRGLHAVAGDEIPSRW